MQKRKEYNYKAFDQSAAAQTNLIQLLTGMQEIKLHNSEKIKRWEWERLQARMFRLSQSTLSIGQYEQAGTILINEVKNILITYLTARAVIQGEITFGVMLSIQYIIGQVNAPIGQLIGFVHVYQEAKISLERLDEIQQQKDEEDDTPKLIDFPSDHSIQLQNITFSYPGADPVLKGITLKILEGKTTAIVGPSGSGKTTLLKLLLRFYDPAEGEIKLGSAHLKNIGIKQWRERCGAVLQDGFIFNDDIARNIIVGDEEIDWQKLRYAVNTANLQQFIDSLPLGYQTKIGADGQGLSQGQKQRLLIARAVYKNPDFLFFDEATNSLDANNEKVIVENLNTFLQGKTVVIIAHRLSTVIHADQIIVLDKGSIIEKGTHQSLTKLKGNYYELVKNQLELGM